MRYIKWLAYLPLAIILGFIATALVNIGGQLVFGWFKFTSAFMCIASGVLGVSVMFEVAKKIAPLFNQFVKKSLAISILLLGGFQIINFFVDLGYSGNLMLSCLSVRYGQSFIGVGLLLGLFMNHSNRDEEENNYDLDNNSLFRGTIQDIESYILRIVNKEDVLSIMFNDSSDFVNIKNVDDYLIVSFPIISDRMKLKIDLFKESVIKYNGVLDLKGDVVIKASFENDRISDVKEVLKMSFDLDENSNLDYQIQ